MTQISVENLSKSYSVAVERSGLAGAMRGLFQRRQRQIAALDDVSFSLERGELLGFIGPERRRQVDDDQNSFRHPAPQFGELPCRRTCSVGTTDTHVGRIGVVFGQRTQLWWDLPVDRVVRAAARYLPGRPAAVPRHLTEVARRRAGDRAAAGRAAATASLGQRMRCEIASFASAWPSILFLDGRPSAWTRSPSWRCAGSSSTLIRDGRRHRHPHHARHARRGGSGRSAL